MEIHTWENWKRFDSGRRVAVKIKFGPKPKDGESTGPKTRHYKKKKEGGVPFGFAQDKESRPRTEAKKESEDPPLQGVVWQPAGEGEAETLPADLKKVTLRSDVRKRS